MNPLPVIVVGDFMLDRRISGSSTRLSPEAGVPVVKIDQIEDSLGGAGNVVANLRGLGIEAIPMGVIGDDTPGTVVLALLERLGCTTRFISVVDGRPTTTKSRVLVSGSDIVRIDQEETSFIPSEQMALMLKGLEETMPVAGVCIISDYGKGIWSYSLRERLIANAIQYDLPIIVDPKSRLLSDYSGVTGIIPNRIELSEAFGEPLVDESAIIEVSQRIRLKHNIRWVLVTQDLDGMTLVSADGAIHFLSEAQIATDVVGAGDTVIAVLAAGLCWQLKLEDATRLASAAAGIVVEKPGTSPITLGELKAATPWMRERWSRAS